MVAQQPDNDARRHAAQIAAMDGNGTPRPALPAGLRTRAVESRDLPAIQLLHADRFGPGRFARTAYRLREDTPPMTPYCRVAELDDSLIGAIRFTHIAIGACDHALLLGPLAVATGLTNIGIGHRLVREGLAAAAADARDAVLLVGDMPYYGRFGFKPTAPGQLQLPGPVDPSRLLICDLQCGTDAEPRSFAGVVRRLP